MSIKFFNSSKKTDKNLTDNCLIFILAIIVGICLSQPPKAQAQDGSTKPKLVVFLIADQFPYNYFSSCIAKSSANGLKHLADTGANFTACRYSDATSQTAPGLAIIATGAYPWSNGIVGNEWYDRRKQKTIKACLGEENVQNTDESNASGGHILAGTTLGDELKIATGGSSRVITISNAEQDAMLLAGKLGNHTYWWDRHSGNFVATSAITAELPPWVKKFNGQHYSEQFQDKTWQPLPQVSSSMPAGYKDYVKTASNPEVPFAHTVNDAAGEGLYGQFITTPWANQMLIDFAKEAIDQENLGQHDAPDMLNISFPSFEIVGKNYGTYSQESRDMVLRFDRSVSDFLQYLDKKIGLSNCLIVFTASHGAAASPELMKNQGMDAGVIEAKAFRNQLNTALSSKLGSSNWIEAFTPPNVYLNLSAVDHSTYRQPDIEKLAAKYGRAVSGVAEIYTAFQLFANQLPSGPQIDMVRKSYSWGRSGELYVVPKPGYVFASENDGIVGGSPYTYDTQVPLIISGGSVKPGTYTASADPADIAPTVANILGICSPPFTEGHTLTDTKNAAR